MKFFRENIAILLNKKHNHQVHMHDYSETSTSLTKISRKMCTTFKSKPKNNKGPCTGGVVYIVVSSPPAIEETGAMG
jgi:hypothetical protein